jgi:hypothetical protein
VNFGRLESVNWAFLITVGLLTMFRKVDRSPQPTHSQIACHAAPPSHADAARTRARRRGAARQLPPAFFFFPLGSSPLLFKAPSHSRSCRTRPAACLPPSLPVPEARSHRPAESTLLCCHPVTRRRPSTGPSPPPPHQQGQGQNPRNLSRAILELDCWIDRLASSLASCLC